MRDHSGDWRRRCLVIAVCVLALPATVAFGQRAGSSGRGPYSGVAGGTLIRSGYAPATWRYRHVRNGIARPWQNPWYYDRIGYAVGGDATAPLDPRLLGRTQSTSNQKPIESGSPAPAEPAPPSEFEVGQRLLAEGRASEAAASFASWLEMEPTDVEALRSYAIAAFMDGRRHEALGCLRLAYQMLPSLASFPIGAEEVGGRTVLRSASVRAVRTAHELDSASAWLFAAVLTQGDRRPKAVGRMLDRAEAAGLEMDIVDAMRVELSDRRRDSL